jgi:GNAT superfamily N-acetyltransferase
MPLPVLRNPSASSPADFIRLFHQSQLEWSRHLGEEIQLDFGRWISNPSLPGCDDANCLLDAYLVPGISPSQLLTDMDARCQRAGVPWRRCSLNPSVPADQIADLIRALQSAGWRSTPLDVLYKIKGDGDLFCPPGLTVIPARASYRHYRQLIEQREAGSADIALMHLDDSHVDSLLALRGGEPVGCISLLTSGEVGTVRDWYVTVNDRYQGIGRLLLNRAMEICVRGLLRHVMISLPMNADTAHRLCEASGFQSIGQWNAYHHAASFVGSNPVRTR